MNVGFGFIDKATSAKYAITVSENLDYEISFWFRQATREPSFELSVKFFNCDLTTEIRPIDIRSGAFNNVLIPANQKICSLEQRWNFFHAVIYAKDHPVENGLQPLTSHAAGTNLIMREGMAKMFINLICTKNCFLVWDFKVRPLRIPFSTGFLGANGLLEIFRKNNRKDFSSEQIDNIAAKFLLSADASTSVINL